MTMFRVRRGVLAGSPELALFAPFAMAQSAVPADDQQDALFTNWALSPGLRADDAYVTGDYQLTDTLQAYGSVALFTTISITNNYIGREVLSSLEWKID